MNDIKEQTCCFTGHRMIAALERNSVSESLEQKIIENIKIGYRYFMTGGALGFDTMAALTVLKLKCKYPQIKLILVLPCKNQTKNWKKPDKDAYKNILSQADKAVYVSEEYTAECMHLRNQYLVDNSSVCICYLKKKSSGTAYTVKYAESKGLKVENIAKK